MIRVAHIVPAYINRITGPRNSVSSLSKALNSGGVQSSVFSTVCDEPFFWNGSEILPIGLFDHNKYDYVVIASLFDSKAYQLLKSIPKGSARIILSPRGSLIHRALAHHCVRKAIYLGTTYRGLLGRLSAVHYLTEDERRASLRLPAPSFVASNGVYSNKDHGPSLCDSSTGDRYSRPEFDEARKSGTVIGFLGRLDINHKGLDLLVAAARRVRRDLERAGAILRLNGPDMHNGQMYIDRFVSRNRLEGLVFRGGSLDAEAKSEFLSGCSFFVHTSRYEGQPQAVQEALFSGVPVIVSTGTNLQSLVLSKHIGYTCFPTVQSIATSLVEAVFSSASQREEMSRGAHTVARNFFDWTHCAQDFMTGLKETAPL